MLLRAPLISAGMPAYLEPNPAHSGGAQLRWLVHVSAPLALTEVRRCPAVASFTLLSSA